MAKHNFTELARQCVTDTMDILGGKAISMGPRNPIAHAYMAMPISVTVEGANILTRTLIVFGQGVHPLSSLRMGRGAGRGEERRPRASTAAFFGHIGHVVRNASRSGVVLA